MWVSTSILPFVIAPLYLEGIPKNFSITSGIDVQSCNISLKKKQLKCVSWTQIMASVRLDNSYERADRFVRIYKASPDADSTADTPSPG